MSEKPSEKKKDPEIKRWINLGTKLEKTEENIGRIVDPVDEFSFGCAAFRGVYMRSVIPDKEMSLKIRWTAIEIPGQGSNIVLREVVMNYKKDTYKVFSKNFCASFSLDTDGTLRFPLGKYVVEVFEDNVFVKKKEFRVKEGCVLDLADNKFLNNPQTHFSKSVGKIFVCYQSTKTHTGEGKMQWMYTRKINSEVESPKELDSVVVNDKEYDRITHDLDISDIDPGFCRVEVYFKVNEKFVLEAYKDFVISPQGHLQFGTELTENSVLKNINRIFPQKTDALFAKITTECIFPAQAEVSVKWSYFDVSSVPEHTTFFECDTKMPNDFNAATFSLKKPDEDFRMGVYQCKVSIANLITESRVFFIGTTFEIDLGTQILQGRGTPFISSPTKKFSSQTKRIFGLCKSNKTFAKGTPLKVVWLKHTEMKKKEKEEKEEMKEFEIVVKHSLLMHEDCNVMMFAFNQPAIDNAFPVGQHLIRVYLHEILVDESNFIIIK